MKIKHLFFAFFTLILISCSEDNDVTIARNLQEYIENNSSRTLDNVIACAANADGNTALSYVFYYPITGASEIQYFETTNTTVNEKDFKNYRRVVLPVENVFGGKLQRFNRSGSAETWCIVTYLTAGKLHISNPIRLKNNSKPTKWETTVSIDNSQSLKPIFSWTDFGITDNEIYFQVISDVNKNFISGTYTKEKMFQYYKTNNVVLNINTDTLKNLTVNTTYNFTLMGVSEDNWVNLVIESPFVAE